jgi:diguanylate cyclase (GGDEF)-like protein/PAS domain S-box-containing protein
MARSLRFWLALGLSAIVGLAIALVAIALLSVLVPRLNDQVESSQHAVGVTLAGQIGDYLTGSVADLERLAADIAEEPLRGSERRRIVLDTLAQTRVDLDALYFIDDRGIVIDVGLPTERRRVRPDLLGLDFSARGFFAEALRTGLPVWSDTFLSTRGTITVAAAVPLRRPGNGPLRLLVGEFDLEWVSRHVASLAEDSDVVALVVDAQGHLVAHPDAARVVRQESFHQLPEVDDSDARRGSARRFRLDGVEHIGTAIRIGGPGWTAVIAQPAEKAFATVRSTLRAVALGSLGALLLALLTAYAYGRRLVHRVREFGEHARAVAEGDYTAPLPFSRAEELNVLATSMRQMANAILERERALADSEARYRGLFDKAPLAYQSLSMETTLLEVNEAWLALTGYAREEVIGRPITDFIEPTSLPVLAENFPRFVSTGHIDGPVFVIQRKDGGSRTVVINGRIYHDGDGSARTHCILTDITDRLRLESAKAEAEATLRRQAERAAALLELPNSAAELEEKDFLRHGLEVLERLTGSRIAFAHFVDEDQRSLSFGTWSRSTLKDYCRAVECEHYPLAEAGIWADALRTRAAVIYNAYAEAPGRKGLPEGHSPLERLVSVPVIEGEAVRLLVGIGNKAEPYAQFDVETARLLSQDIWRLIARQRADSAQRLAASVFSASAEGICITDAARRIVSVNPALQAITGYAADEIIGQTPRVFSSGRHDADFYREMWARINERGVWRGEIWNRRKSGEIYPEWLTVTAVKDAAGAVINYIGSFFDISDRKRAEEDIRFLAHHDPLTKLPNRTLLDDRIRQAIAKSRRNRDHTAVLFLDLDRFKLVNDTLGHDVGDRLLERVAERLRSVLRETETVARLGGDEFIIVVPELADIDRVGLIAQKVIDVVSQPQEVDGRQLHVTPSIGISVYPDDGDDAQTLLRSADTAMYHAKECGRNNYQFFTAAMNKAVHERVAIEEDLRGALGRGELLLHYQPQVDSRSGEIHGMEALVRWQHPERGLVAPDRFIPIAEETGLIVGIGEWVLREACRQAKRWHDAGHTSLRIGVNLSARQFQQSDLQQQIARALSDSGLDPAALELELTESMLMADPQAATELLQRLAELGIQLAIDDFGTGYSSLAYLKRFPVARLKIDRSFVRDISTDPNDAAIVRAVVAMADSLRMAVIAEGVETAEQLRFLERHGCYEVQGYFFSRPAAAESFSNFRFPLPGAQ